MFTFSFSTAFAATKSAEDYVNDAFNTLSTESAHGGWTVHVGLNES